MIIDTHERKSLDVLMAKFPEAIIAPLEIGDIYEGNYLIELKIGMDVHDYARMADELYRMSMRDEELHAIYVGMDIVEYSIFMNYCQQYNVWGHRCNTIHSLADKVYKIISGKYVKGKPSFKKPNKELSPFARMLASFNGITEENAIKLTELYGVPMFLTHVIPDDTITFRRCFSNVFFNGVFGMNKDGSEKAIVKKFRDFWEGN